MVRHPRIANASPGLLQRSTVFATLSAGMGHTITRNGETMCPSAHGLGKSRGPK